MGGGGEEYVDDQGVSIWFSPFLLLRVADNNTDILTSNDCLI